MTQPHYQIFVSSTYQDLKEERKAVLEAILKLNQFPAAMETFPAVNDTAWEHIEKVIKDSDYYVLIIGGKYGSIDAESGLSYTEKEYDFAVSNSIPVLAFTRSDEDSIPVGKAEMNEEIRAKLKKFKDKVGTNHHWNYWKSLDELKGNVISSLSQSFVMNPQKGWVKAGGIEKSELLERLAELQKKYDDLAMENSKLKESSSVVAFGDLSFGDEIFQFKYHIDLDGENFDEYEIDVTWNDLFDFLSEFILTKKTESDVRTFLYSFVYKHIGLNEHNEDDEHLKHSVGITESTINSIRNQFLALELMKLTELSIEGSMYSAWHLTERGKKLFLNNKAIRPNN
jgi:Domain of unknown function (DUF4062)